MKNFFVLAIYSVVFATLISLVGMVSDLVSEAVFFGDQKEPFWTGFFRMLAIQMIFITAAYFLVGYLNKRVSWTRQTLLRISIEVMAVLVMGAMMVAIAGISANNLENVTQEEVGRFLMVVSMTSFLMGLLAFSFIEVWFRIKENRRLELNIAQLEQRITMSQYQALRQQLNPHFLFNSLNTLASLIYVDVEKADAFIQEFAEVYRYVLRLNHAPTVTVRDELDFLHSYLFLLRIRFNDNLVYQETVDPAMFNGRIPPLTLQLLIENAIKHNEVSAENPLQIHVETKGKELVVRNNVQLRQDVPHRNGYGWQNLRERYQLMGEREPGYEQTDAEFVARVPIIMEKNELQRTDR